MFICESHFDTKLLLFAHLYHIPYVYNSPPPFIIVFGKTKKTNRYSEFVIIFNFHKNIIITCITIFSFCNISYYY